MGKLEALAASLIAIAACSCGGREEVKNTDSETISVTPPELTCNAEENTLTLHVQASKAFQAFAEDGIEWVSVDPPYSSASEADVTVKVEENASYKDRNTEITIKCGSTRKKVALVQKAMQKGQLDINVPDGYHLVWRDEFDTDGLPSREWWYETGGGGWGNNELQSYVSGSASDGTRLADISDGTLKIKAMKIGSTVNSIRMNTSQGWTYGWFEARIKVTDSQGAWPAFWMMPKNFTAWPKDGEIDIMEYAIGTQGKNRSSSSIHCAAFNWPNGTQKTHAQSVSNAATEFHTYALEWTQERMVFYIDGKSHLTFENDGRGYDHWPFDNPFYLKLNLAWGGNMGGTANEAQLPAIYEIDYVRVFQKD